MSARTFVTVVAIGSAAAACATPPPKRLLDLPQPVYSIHVERADCGDLRAIDMERHFFTESGCLGATTGFVRHGRVSDAQARAVAQAFDKLPHEKPCDGGTPVVYIFSSRVGNVQKTWRVCAPDMKAPLPPAFAAVQAAFPPAP